MIKVKLNELSTAARFLVVWYDGTDLVVEVLCYLTKQQKGQVLRVMLTFSIYGNAFVLQPQVVNYIHHYKISCASFYSIKDCIMLSIIREFIEVQFNRFGHPISLFT